MLCYNCNAYLWAWVGCQLVYNPQLIQGLGLSDGEGMERLWSHFIKLIGIQHTSLVGQYNWRVMIVSHYYFQCQRHIWLIDCHAGAVAKEMVADLGDWLWRWLKKGIEEQGSAAQEVLDFVSNGQINVLLSYLSERICCHELTAADSWTKTLLQMHLFNWRKNLMLFLFYKPSSIVLTKCYRKSASYLTGVQHPKVPMMLWWASNAVMSDCCAKSMPFIPPWTFWRGLPT